MMEYYYIIINGKNYRAVISDSRKGWVEREDIIKSKYTWIKDKRFTNADVGMIKQIYLRSTSKE